MARERMSGKEVCAAYCSNNVTVADCYTGQHVSILVKAWVLLMNQSFQRCADGWSLTVSTFDC